MSSRREHTSDTSECTPCVHQTSSASATSATTSPGRRQPGKRPTSGAWIGTVSSPNRSSSRISDCESIWMDKATLWVSEGDSETGEEGEVSNFVFLFSPERSMKWIGGIYNYASEKWHWGQTGRNMTYKAFSQMQPGWGFICTFAPLRLLLIYWPIRGLTNFGNLWTKNLINRRNSIKEKRSRRRRRWSKWLNWLMRFSADYLQIHECEILWASFAGAAKTWSSTVPWWIQRLATGKFIINPSPTRSHPWLVSCSGAAGAVKFTCFMTVW